MAAVAVQIRRHGDVMVKTYDGFKIPKGAKLKAVKVLHQGNNHEHYISAGRALVGEKDGKKYLRVVGKSATLDHLEHGKGQVPSGDYYVEIKSEFDHFLEESRAVID